MTTLAICGCFADNCYLTHEIRPSNMQEFLFGMRKASSPLIQEWLWCSSMETLGDAPMPTNTVPSHYRLATFLMVATKSVGTPKAATPRSDRQRFSRIMWKSVLN